MKSQENLKEYLSQIDRCKYCGSTNLNFNKTETTIHFGKLECANCKRFVCWVKDPNSARANSLRTNKKTIRQICDFHDCPEEICFFCLRERKQLGDKETLTIDHIRELDKGGRDQLNNMQVLCSACHKLKNWSRLYMNWHFKEEGDNGNTNS